MSMFSPLKKSYVLMPTLYNAILTTCLESFEKEPLWKMATLSLTAFKLEIVLNSTLEEYVQNLGRSLLTTLISFELGLFSSNLTEMSEYNDYKNYAFLLSGLLLSGINYYNERQANSNEAHKGFISTCRKFHPFLLFAAIVDLESLALLGLKMLNMLTGAQPPCKQHGVISINDRRANFSSTP